HQVTHADSNACRGGLRDDQYSRPGRVPSQLTVHNALTAHKALTTDHALAAHQALTTHHALTTRNLVVPPQPPAFRAPSTAGIGAPSPPVLADGAPATTCLPTSHHLIRVRSPCVTVDLRTAAAGACAPGRQAWTNRLPACWAATNAISRASKWQE